MEHASSTLATSTIYTKIGYYTHSKLFINMKLLFENWRKSLNESEYTNQMTIEQVEEVVLMFSKFYNNLPDDESKELFEEYLNKNVRLYTEKWQEERNSTEEPEELEIEY